MLIALLGVPARAHAADGPADRSRAPKLPLAQWWTVPLEGRAEVSPVTDSTRVFIALASGDLTARDAGDGHELWRIKKSITIPMAAGGDRVFVAAADAIEALAGSDGRSAWVLPRATPVAPLLLDGDTLFVVTETDVIAVNAASGEVRWRRPAGGVQLPPAIDGDRLFVGANDGRLLALSRADGAQVWERFFNGGVTALGAGQGRVYVGAGDKYLYCLDTAKSKDEWQYRVGAIPTGHVAVDDEHVYFSSRDNTTRGLDRRNGNQRWNQPLRERPTAGAQVYGRVVFVPAAASQLSMLYERDGRPSGTLTFPGDQPAGLAPAFVDTPHGAVIFVVTGGLTNEWSLTKFAPAGDTALLPFANFAPFPGLPFLTDPTLTPIANVLTTLLIGDPPLQPLSQMEFPIVLRDPPLLPLTVLPGLPLRPLSPVLPVRRGAL